MVPAVPIAIGPSGLFREEIRACRGGRKLELFSLFREEIRTPLALCRRRRSFTTVGALEEEASFWVLRPKKCSTEIFFEKVFPKIPKRSTTIFICLHKKRSTKIALVPVSRLKSKILTSNLVQKSLPPTETSWRRQCQQQTSSRCKFY